MAAVNCNKVSTGITLSFESGFTAELLEITPPAQSRASIDMTHHNSDNNRKEFCPGVMVDPGEIQATILFDASAVPPIDEPKSSAVITFPDGTTWTMSAFLTNYAPSTPFEGRMEAAVTIKVSGNITVA